ncbi:hypothetical protein [Kutzneria sp. 744]|uniref:hypothetical protein n=1 Tax=Kutzneria sp. (strain 744) TaxID=345341 RepID=UPI0003EEB151|nr:hypothetical protein [Kutzneria sp. 744]EWM16135.1 hypothetical protein KUTG_06439 [Kutzneria sp. 744]
MVATRVIAAGAAVAAFTIVAVAPAAYADTSNNRDNNDNNASLRIDPSQRSYRGGDKIKLDARCDSNRADIAISAALDNVKEWVRTGRKDFNIQATARVRDDVKSGNFEISFRCGNQKISVMINVDNGNRGGGGGNGGGGTTTTNTTTNTTTSSTVDTSTTMVYPSGAPQTGGQGPSDTGSGLLLAELGGVALVGAAGVGVAVTRRRKLAVQRG